MSEKRVLWDTFRAKKKEVTGSYKRRHNEELRNFQVVCVYVASRGEMRHAHGISVRKPKNENTAFKNNVERTCS